MPVHLSSQREHPIIFDVTSMWVRAEKFTSRRNYLFPDVTNNQVDFNGEEEAL
jgi:hypothetical protein